MIDEVTFDCEKCKGTMRRTPEILDVWFDSGSMPYSVPHYPFENKEWLEDDKHFPADFIAEYIAQTRGWYYSLHVLSTALFNKPAFTNAVSTGTLMAADGSKLSKSKRNYTDPLEVFQQFGADAPRFYLMAGPVMRAGNVNFSDDDVKNYFRNIVMPLWNAYSFFVTYANIDEWEPPKKPSKKIHELDRWILSELNVLVKNVTEHMDNYDVVSATSLFEEFIDGLTNWYIRRSRRRFWKSEDDGDKQAAYETLYEVLVTFSKILAPVTPFITENIYKNLTGEESVHLSDWPEVDESAIDQDLNTEMQTVRTVVRLGLAARAKANIKVRQPLAKVEVAGSADEARLIQKNEEIIKSELNVKDLAVLDAVPDSVEKKLSPNARLLGPKFGKDVQKIIQLAKQGEFEQTKSGYLVGSWELAPEEAELQYESKEGFAVEAERSIVVALDPEVTDELKREGYARDIVRVVQDLRKESGLEVDNHIQLTITSDDAEIQNTLSEFDDYIKQETLADGITSDTKDAHAKEVDIDGKTLMIAITRA